MKTQTHPDYVTANVRCSCGNTFTTRSVKPELRVELCNECHPFFTGKQKLVDTGGRVERFERRYGRRGKGSGSKERGAALDPARPSAPLAAKLGALVRDRWGEEATGAPRPFPGGAGLVAGSRGWVLADERPARSLGG